jgi:fructosamine-3-kinase
LSDQAVAEYVSTLDPSLGQAEKIDKLMDRFRITDVNQAVRMFNRASEQRVVARESSLLAAARRIANGTADENDYTMVTEFLETGGDQENRFRTTRKINAILNQGQQTNE